MFSRLQHLMNPKVNHQILSPLEINGETYHKPRAKSDVNYFNLFNDDKTLAMSITDLFNDASSDKFSHFEIEDKPEKANIDLPAI